MAPPKIYDFKDYTRLGEDTLILFIAHRVKMTFKAIWLYVLILFFNSKFNWIFVCAVSGLLIYNFVYALMSYYGTTIKVDEGNVYIRIKVWRVELITIPIQNIHVIRTKSGWLYQLLDMKCLSFDTLATKKEEVQLYMNDNMTAQFLKSINAYRDVALSLNIQPVVPITPPQSPFPTSGNTPPVEDAIQPSAQPPLLKQTYRTSMIDLLTGAVLQNPFKAFVPAFIALATFFNQFENYTKWAFERLDEWDAETHFTMHLSSLPIFCLLLFSTFTIAMLFWTAHIVLQQYRQEIQLTQRTFRIEEGLLHRRTSMMPKDKIIHVSFKTNLLEKWAKRSTIRVHQASNADGKKRVDGICLYGYRQADILKNWWLKDSDIFHAEKCHSGIGYFYLSLCHLFLLCGVVIGILYALYCAFNPFTYLSLGIAISCCIVQTIGLAYMRQQRSSIALDQRFILLYQGTLANVYTTLPIDKIEKIKFRQSIFQKRSGTASLFFITKERTHSIHSIPYATAIRLRNYLNYRLETSN